MYSGGWIKWSVLACSIGNDIAGNENTINSLIYWSSVTLCEKAGSVIPTTHEGMAKS